VILVDANILLHAYHARSQHHARCREWLEDAFVGSTPIRLAWFTIVNFVRISTSDRVFEQPLGIREAADAVSSWLAAPAVALLQPGERYWEILRGLLHRAQESGPPVMGAALAALALEHDAILCTTDASYGSFASLKTMDPTED
jgi:toxin-antitoxin system PIN domain toxin